MLDITDFIASRGGDPEKIRQSQKKRNASTEIVDEIISLWETHRTTQYAATQIAAEMKTVQAEIAPRKKKGEPIDDLLAKKDEITQRKAAQDKAAADLLEQLEAKVRTVGNYVHESVPVSTTEDDNAVLRTWSPETARPTHENLLSHHQVLARLEGYDPERGTKLAGHRGYCLTGWGLFLNQALINFGLEYLFGKGYSPNQPPFFMDQAYMAKTAQLSQFDEELYKITEKDTEPKYLIATSEQPLSALHSDEWLQGSDLPIKYAGYSTCFRKEAGKHGHDTWGIFRIHQFEKIEQFVICNPEDSWKHYDEMIAISEEFYKKLELPYRVVGIVSSALNNAAAAKYDLEAIFPFQKDYKELVSCSNCTDYQTRELGIRFGPKKQKGAPDSAKKTYTHALNATLCATERTLCCILENYQTPDGIIVPEVLRKYIPGQRDFLPFTKELTKEIPIRKKA
ncbi:seryl-tRNA synthetase [Astrocystis sublimbata]|nr:seryl-tRNA synthetase [Astrocystis sublimbata]